MRKMFFATVVLLVTLTSLFTLGCGSSVGEDEWDAASVPDAWTERDSTADAATCVPSCEGRACGDDGCGSTCGICSPESVCDEASGSCGLEGEAGVDMRDGTRLRTRVYLPAGTPPYPTVLRRTPYWEISGEGYNEYLSKFTEHGYAFVVQAVRGTAGSEGELTPLVQEFDDGEDNVSWIVEQPWSDGNVGAFGASYEGFTAVATAMRSSHVKVVVADGFLSHAYRSWPISHNGVLGWHLLWWLHLIETGEDLFSDIQSLTTATKHRPPADLDVALFGEETPLWRRVTPHMEADSDYWSAWSFEGKLSDVCTPMLLFQAATEWEDDVLDTYRELMQGTCSPEAKAQQRYYLGEHGHSGAVGDPFASSDAAQLFRDYLDTFLKGEDVGLSGVADVQVHIQRSNRWVTSDSWPPVTDQLSFYLDSVDPDTIEGTLNATLPGMDDSLTYRFDPTHDDACDTVYTGNAAYLSPVLIEPLDIAGVPEFEVHLSVNTPDTDIFVYLCEIRENDPQWHLITLDALRLRFRDSFTAPTPLEADTPVTLRMEMVAVGYRVAAGSRLGLFIASSECGSSENSNTGAQMMTAVDTQPADITILTGPSHPSRLLVPVAAP